MVTTREERPHAVVIAAPTFGQVMRSLRPSDFALWSGLSLFGAGYGYAAGRTKRMGSMWVSGLVGFFGGFCLVMQNSSSRLLGWSENGREQKVWSSRQVQATSFAPLSSSEQARSAA